MVEKQENNSDGEYWPQKDVNTQIICELGNDEIENLFTPLKNKINEENIFEFLKNIIEHIHKLVKKEKMENEYIDKHLWNLSARELLSRGKTFYMNPCLDFVLVTIEWLKRTGIKDTRFVIEELQCPGNRFKLHFGVEICINEDIYHIDHRTKNMVIIGKGKFESDYTEKWESVAHTIHIDANHITPDDTIHTLIEKWLIPLKFFDTKILEILKEKLKKDNNEEQRENWFVSQVKDIHKPEIIIKENNEIK